MTCSSRVVRHSLLQPCSRSSGKPGAAPVACSPRCLHMPHHMKRVPGILGRAGTVCIPATQTGLERSVRMFESGAPEPMEIYPGMPVDTTQGDLGEGDLSKPQVAEIIEDGAGRIEKIIVQKGLLFTKQIEVPVERIERIEPAEEDDPSGAKLVI